MIRTPHARLALLATLAGCASGPPDQSPIDVLSRGEGHLVREEYELALEVLEDLEPESFTGDDVERFKVGLATALAGSGELWDAFLITRDFEEDHPFSDYSGAVQQLEFEIGRSLINSTQSFWIFHNAADDGQVVLEHFVLRYPQHPNTADALRLLGEKAYSEQDYFLARQRFSELVLKHPDSEWISLARFRVAMASFDTLEGPDYDQVSMERAANELDEFLRQGIENPQFTDTAVSAFETVRSWLAEKHLRIADLYRIVGNEPGERLHLERASARYPDTDAGRRAAELLAAPADPAQPEPSPPAQPDRNTP